MLSWVRRNPFFKLLPLVPPEFEAAMVVTHRTWKVTLLHWDGARAPLTIGVSVEQNVRTGLCVLVPFLATSENLRALAKTVPCMCPGSHTLGFSLQLAHRAGVC